MTLNSNILRLGFALLVLVGCGEDAERKGSEPGADLHLETEDGPKTTDAGDVVNATRSLLDTPSSLSNLNEARDQVLNEYAQLAGSVSAPLSPQGWRTLWHRYWTSTLDLSVKGKDERLGTVLTLLTVPEGQTPLVAQLATGDFTDDTDSEEQRFLIAAHMLAMTVASNGGASLPAAVSVRSEDTGIRRSDLFLFQVFDDAFVDVPQGSGMSPDEVGQWEALARSPNPLYRLLALRTFRRVAPEPEQWLRFYGSYVHEKDLAIAEEAIDLAFQTARPEATRLLEDIREGLGESAPPELLDKIDRSIAWLRNRLPGAR